MQRLTSEGTRLWMQSGTPPLGTAIASATQATPAVVTLQASSLQFAAGTIVKVAGTGWASLDGRAFQVRAVNGLDVTLADADTTGETTTVTGGTLTPIELIDFCTVSLDIVSPAGSDLDTTTIADQSRTMMSGLPGLSTWQIGGFWDITEQAQARARQLYRSREVVVFVAQLQDGTGLVFNANLHSLELHASLDQPVTIAASGTCSGSASVLDDGVTPVSSTLYLAPYLGYMNVFIRGRTRPVTFSQQGDFVSARWVSVDTIATVGPDPEFPNGFIRFRTLPISNTIVVFYDNGQSNGAGAFDSFSSALAAGGITINPPLPDNCSCYVGGIMPTQDGANSDGVATIIADAQFASTVPLKEDINTGRVPGKEVLRETWSAAMAESVAAQLDETCIVLKINTSHGSTDFSACVQHAEVLTGASWAANVVHFIFANNTNVAPTDSFKITGCAQNGYNGSFIAVAPTDGVNVYAAMTIDPGVWVPPVLPANNGFALVWSAPIVNGRKMVRWAHDVLGPALGKAVLFGGVCYQGNEADSAMQGTANYLTQADTLQQVSTEFGAICGNTFQAPVMGPQVGYPRDSWREKAGSVLGTASMVALGQLEASRDPARKFITWGQYAAIAAGEGDVTPQGAIHYGKKGHANHGVDCGWTWGDWWLGLDVTPPQLVKGSLQMVANRTLITGTFSRPMKFDGAMRVSNPGKGGYQAFAGVLQPEGGRGNEIVLDSVEIDGTSFKGTLHAPIDVTKRYGVFIGYGYANAKAIQAANNTPIVSSSYDAPSGMLTLNTSVPHGLAPASALIVVGNVPAGANVLPPENGVTQPDTAGTAIKVLKADPGVLAVTGFSWAANVGTFTVDSDQSFNIGGTLTVAGCSPAALNAQWAVKAQPTLRSFTVDMPSDPGPFVSGGTVSGGGSVALNGKYCVARNEGLRGIARAQQIDWSNQRTGEPRARWQALQFEGVTLQSSTNSIWAMLVELGLDGEFDGVFDFAAAACYPGSGTLLTNQRGLANTNFTLGDGGLRLPVWSGVVDSFARTTGIYSTGNAEINATNGTANTLLANAHKSGQGGTLIFGGFCPSAAPTRNNYLFANCQGEATGAGVGTFLRIATNRNLTFNVRGDANSTVLASPSFGGALAANDFFLCGIGWADRDNTSWIYRGVTNVYTVFTPVYSAPSVNPAQSAPSMMMNGTTGSIYFENGFGIQFALMANHKVLMPRVAPLFESLRRRQNLNQGPPP